jgi:WD40 repeat protein
VDTGIAARQVNADTIEVTSGGWSYAFEGSAPAFKPDGTLTFVRDGRLYEWTARCPEKARIIRFQELHDVPRCIEPVTRAPRGIREVAWLDDGRYAAVAGPDGAMSVLVVGNAGVRRLFTGVGTRVGALEASPGGGYLVARLDGAMALFRTASPGVQPLPPTGELVRGIAWSPDDRLAALVTESAVRVFPVARPNRSVALPLSVAAARWR